MGNLELRYQLTNLRQGPGGTLHASFTPLAHEHFDQELSMPTNGRIDIFVTSDEAQQFLSGAQRGAAFCVTIEPEDPGVTADYAKRMSGPRDVASTQEVGTGNQTQYEDPNASPYRLQEPAYSPTAERYPQDVQKQPDLLGGGSQVQEPPPYRSPAETAEQGYEERDARRQARQEQLTEQERARLQEEQQGQQASQEQATQEQTPDQAQGGSEQGEQGGSGGKSRRGK